MEAKEADVRRKPCMRCGTPKEGLADLCVFCLGVLTHPCYQCCTCHADGKWRPRKRGREGKPIDCKACNNERIVTDPY